MKGQRIGRVGVLVVLSFLLGGSAFGAEAKELRICADPDNLPFSNQRLEGFENKIAELIAKDLHAPLTYYWWPHQRGLVRNTLRADKCDVLIGIPKGFDPVLWTKPYYRTAYVVAYPRSKGFKIKSLDDPILKQMKIGVYLDTPPYGALGERGMMENVVVYSLLYDYGGVDQTRHPGRLMEDLIAGSIDVAIVWGPIAGYFAKEPNAPALELVPLQNSGAIPMTFEISMGVRKGDKELKTRLEEALDRRQAEIRKVLEDYGVPLLAPAGASSAQPTMGQNQPKPKKLNPYTGNPAAIEEGRALYLGNGCSGCHGVMGGGGMGVPLIDDVWVFGSDDETLFKLIKGRIAQQTMPPVFGATLDDDQVWKILAYIRSLYKGDPSKIDW